MKVIPRVLSNCFWLLLGVTVMLTGCGGDGGSKQNRQSHPSYAAGIQKTLSADEELAAIRNQACSQQPLDVVIRQYLAGIDSLDFSACPADFTRAFRAHRDAWQASVPFFAGFGELRGEMHKVFKTIAAGDEAQRAAYEQALQPINDTWAVVDSLAREYGAL